MPGRALLTLFGVLALLVVGGCGGAGDAAEAVPAAQSTGDTSTGAEDPVATEAAPEPAGPSESSRIVILNEGGAGEGHTPRGFRGSGTGLLAGDNLNPSFPDGDGVQIFLTFPLDDLPAGDVQAAVLASVPAVLGGTPFRDLGDLVADEVRYEAFGPDLWDAEPLLGGVSCVYATSSDRPYSCDVTAAVQRSLVDGHPSVQFRLRFERAGDSDGQADLASFFLTDSNTNEPGIFTITVDLG